MKRQVRIGVFETNSSMTHAIAMCTDSDYQRWANGEVYWNRYVWGDEPTMISKEEVEAELMADYEKFKDEDYYDSFDDYAKSEGYISYEAWLRDEYLETFHKLFNTPSGELIHAFGSYGEDC